jgi:Reductase C-terminal
MLGKRIPYRDGSIFYGSAFGTAYTFMGLVETPGGIVERGRQADGSWSVLYLRHNVLRAVFSVGRRAEESAAVEELIRHRTGLHAERAKLGDAHFSLSRPRKPC